jgi:hypothetical protein
VYLKLQVRHLLTDLTWYPTLLSLPREQFNSPSFYRESMKLYHEWLTNVSEQSEDVHLPSPTIAHGFWHAHLTNPTAYFEFCKNHRSSGTVVIHRSTADLLSFQIPSASDPHNKCRIM